MRFETRDLTTSAFAIQGAGPEYVRQAGEDCTEPGPCSPEDCSEGGTNATCNDLSTRCDDCRPDNCSDCGTNDGRVPCDADAVCTEGGTGPQPCAVTEEVESSAGSLRLDPAALSEALKRQLGGDLDMR